MNLNKNTTQGSASLHPGLLSSARVRGLSDRLRTGQLLVASLSAPLLLSMHLFHDLTIIVHVHEEVLAPLSARARHSGKALRALVRKAELGSVYTACSPHGQLVGLPGTDHVRR